MARDRAWINELRHLHEEAFAFDWHSHLARLNRDFGLQTGEWLRAAAPDSGKITLFNGDFEAIEPDRWVLVVSLNHQVGDPEVYEQHTVSSTSWWDLWRAHNARYFYAPFFRPFVRLMAEAMGEEEPTEEAEGTFASSRAVFVELCPYASQSFSAKAAGILEGALEDYGVRLSRLFRQILIDKARPSLVLVNGRPEAFERTHRNVIEWKQQNYVSNTNPHKELWHMQGWLGSEAGSIPVAGFPFLRKPRTHNSYMEISQLARALVVLAEGR